MGIYSYVWECIKFTRVMNQMSLVDSLTTDGSTYYEKTFSLIISHKLTTITTISLNHWYFILWTKDTSFATIICHV